MMKRPPNILLLQGEDVGRHLGCYGDACARTPHLDQLAAEGVRYANAFSHAPVCAPSRGGMVLGCHPWTVGNHHMRSTLLGPPRCFTHELRDAGYHVSWPTKLDFNFEPLDGWCDDQDPWWDKPPPRQPFLLYENFHQTHESRMFGEPPDWNDNAGFDFPESLRHAPGELPVPPYFPDIPELREQLRAYYDAFTAIDNRIGRRLRWLDRHGLRDNTIVIFLSDHGRGLPREKRWCYGAGLHLPLIIRWPGRLAPGGVRDELVAWVDIAPTLLSLAGARVPEHYQGQAFLGDAQAPPREYVFAGRDRMDEVFDKVRVVRDRKFHYIRNDAPGLPWAQCQSYMENQPAVPVMRALHAEGRLHGDAALFFQPAKPAEELYDAEDDPHMLRNLAGDPAHAATLARLRAALDAHLRRFGDLGDTDELELVRRGLVADRIDEYRARPCSLPPEQRIGPAPVPITLEEARPWLEQPL
jgi:N-sulfoglucosamine sulfohydrolase